MAILSLLVGVDNVLVKYNVYFYTVNNKKILYNQPKNFWNPFFPNFWFTCLNKLYAYFWKKIGLVISIHPKVYSVLSTSPSYIQMDEFSMGDSAHRPSTPLLTPEYCYNGVPTLHSTSLWKNSITLDDALALRESWKLTLNNHGCSSLIKVT